MTGNNGGSDYRAPLGDVLSVEAAARVSGRGDVGLDKGDQRCAMWPFISMMFVEIFVFNTFPLRLGSPSRRRRAGVAAVDEARRCSTSPAGVAEEEKWAEKD